MRHLLSADYFPFGSQYYRAPSPSADAWEKDHENMARLGFNMVKYWVQWRWNHPAEDTYYFEDIDRLMDLAGQNGMRVMLNTIIDVAPAWIYRKYPDASMITLSGTRIGPQAQPHRQIGGLGLCFNHDEAMDHCFGFLRATFEQFSGHPALEIWNVGSEPELTQSMAEMRLYADDASLMGDMLCYCGRCQARFSTWLEQKYDSIEALNRSWNRNYQSFDEVEVPRTRNTFNDIIDWRMFFVSTLGANVKRRFDICAEVDGGRHPLMCHHVFIQGFPITSTASDPWNVGQYGDLHGFTQMDDAMMSDVLRSSARGKPVISAEMLMLYGYTLELPQPIGTDDIKRFIFTGIAANQKGFVFWQYRPETLGREAPAWGLTYPDGEESPWLTSFADVGNVLQSNREFLFEAAPLPAEVAILYGPENQIFVWAATGNEKSATDSMLGTHRALYEYNHRIDFLHPQDFADPAILRDYRVILAPFTYCITERMAAELKQWVYDGGILVAEPYFGAWHIKNGRHQTTVPGYGLHEVFGIRQRVVQPFARNHEYADLKITEELPYCDPGEDVKGWLVGETYFLEGARALASYADGTPAVTIHNYGQGKAIQLGSYIGLPYHRERIDVNGRFLAGLVEYACTLQRPGAEGRDRIRVDILQDGSGSVMVILQNCEGRHVSTEIRLHIEQDILIEQFSGGELRLKATGNTKLGSIELKPAEVRVYRA